MNQQVSRRQFFDATGKMVIGLAVVGVAAKESGAVVNPEACNDAICGIYCGACPGLMNSLKAKKQSEIKCLGCKSTKKGPTYKCEVKKCAVAKNLASCGLCKEFPCTKFAKFFDGAPKYGLREKYLYEVKEKGLAKWMEEQKTRWTCTKCKSPFGYGVTNCPSCSEKIYSDAEELAEYKANKKPNKV